MGARKLIGAVLVVFCAYAVLSAAVVDGVALASTARPLIERVWAAGVGTGGASLYATIVPDPETLPEVASDTTYRFEYGTSTSYGASVPVPDAAIQASTSSVEVSQPLGGLQPNTTYHYRVVAINPSGESVGADRTFSTFPLPPTSDSCANSLIRGAQFSAYLPDCRAYELVSPPYDGKEGANVGTSPYVTQSSVDGNAIKFFSRTAFGDAIGSENLGGAEYIAQRGGEGWATHSINPEQAGTHTQIYSAVRYEALSPDLSKGIFSAMTPIVPGHPNVEGVNNLYFRDDLLSPGRGNYELMSDGVDPVAASMKSVSPLYYFSGNPEIWFAAASEDWSHILFESNHDLTPEAEGLNPTFAKAYEWDKGTVRLVGILPDGKPAEVSLAGRGASYASSIGALFEEPTGEPPVVQGSIATHAISANGSRVVFTGPPVRYYNKKTCLTEPTGQGFFDTAMCGNLYMRIDHKTTVQLNVDERSPSVGPDPNGPTPAMFSAATADDSKVFFSTTEALTDNAPVEPKWPKVYMYDVNAPEGHHLALISVDDEPANKHPYGDAGYPTTAAVVGMDDNANYVYFVDENDLLPGLPALVPSISDYSRLYVWHNGAIKYVVSHQDELDWFRGLAWDTGEFESGDTFRTSADGKTVLFMSSDPTTAGRVGYDNSSPAGTCEGGQHERCYQVYTYNIDSKMLQCASCNTSGVPARNEASFIKVADAFNFHTQYLNHPLSSDGHYVFFDTPEALVPQDTNGRSDVYEYDTVTKRQYLLSSGGCECDSFFVDASPGGHDVFFTTRQRLVFADIDTSADLYDARIGGGIAAQNHPPAVACSGEECQGPVSSPPAFSLPASLTFSGVGNPPVTGAKSIVKRTKHKHVRHRKRHRRRHKSNRHMFRHRSGR